MSETFIIPGRPPTSTYLISDPGTGKIGDGRKTVTSAGTAEKLADNQSCKQVTITAETDNSDVVCVGASTVIASLATRRGVALFPGSSFTVSVNNLNVLWIDAVTSGDGVTYVYVE